MNQDARDESTPTGQALGTIALLVAGTATVAGGIYATKTLANKSAKAVKNKITEVAADLDHEKDLFMRTAGTELSTADAVKIRAQKRMQQRADNFEEAKRKVRRAKYGADDAPTDDEIKQKVMDNLNKHSTQQYADNAYAEAQAATSSSVGASSAPETPLLTSKPKDPTASEYERSGNYTPQQPGSTAGRASRTSSKPNTNVATPDVIPMNGTVLPTGTPVGNVEGFANSQGGPQIIKTDPSKFFTGNDDIPKVTPVPRDVRERREWANANRNKKPTGTSSGNQYVGTDANGNPIYV
jgi:hypothetical protein